MFMKAIKLVYWLLDQRDAVCFVHALKHITASRREGKKIQRFLTFICCSSGIHEIHNKLL